MKTVWFNGLDKQELQDLKVSLAGSLIMRKRLAKLIVDKIDTSVNTARAKTSYDSPNWAFLQADQRGYERAMVEIISLISDDSKEK